MIISFQKGVLYFFLFVLKALKKIGKFVNIQEVMDQWTLQMGYPVITIKRNENTDSIIGISQDHFVYDLDKDPSLRNNRYLHFLHFTIVLILLLEKEKYLHKWLNKDL